MNTITISGRMVKDIEMKRAGEDTIIGIFDLACRNSKKNTTFFNVQLSETQANIVRKYAGKGSYITVSGVMYCNKNEKDGKVYYNWTVYADKFEFGPSSGEQIPR